MKHLTFAFLLLFGLVSCSNENGNLTQSNSIDLSKFEKVDIPGTGYQRVLRKNAEGKVLEEGLVENGKRNGTWVIYHTDRDVPRVIASFVNDLYNGPYFEFNKQGQVDLQCAYVNNVLHGYFARYRIGRKTEEGNYKMGKLDGVYKKYYENRSIVQQENTYKDGQLHGKTRFFDEKGNVIVEYDYENGQKIKGGIVENNATANVEE